MSGSRARPQVSRPKPATDARLVKHEQARIGQWFDAQPDDVKAGLDELAALDRADKPKQRNGG